MTLELTKELININQVVGVDFSQTLVEGDIIVPDVKPDIARILQVDGIAVINDKEVQQDKVLVNGSVHFKILYAPEGPDKSVKSINASSSFTHQVDIKNARPDMKAKIGSDIEHIEFNMLNSRKINVKAVVSIDCKVENLLSLDMITGIAGEGDVQVRKKNIKTYSIVAETNNPFIIREDLEIPAGKPSIKDLLKIDTKVTGKDVKVIDNKVVVKGELNVCTLYVAETDNDSIQFMEHEIPFTEIFDVEEVREGMYCDLEVDIKDVYYDVKEDSDGDTRILSLEATMDAYTRASQEVFLDVVVDSYSPEGNIKLEKKTFNIDEIIDDSRSQTTIKQIIDLPSDVPEIAQIYNVITKPYVTETIVENNRVIVEGVIDAYILYLADSEENPVYSYKQEIPFRHIIDAKDATPDMTCDVKADVTHCSYSKNTASEVEVRCIVGVESRLVKATPVELITNAEFAPFSVDSIKSWPSITIYFVQKGDTLWDIAKQYYVTMDEITRVNEIKENDILPPGKQLIIPRRQRK